MSEEQVASNPLGLLAVGDATGKKLGEIVWWRLRGTLDPVKLEEYLKGRGLECPLPEYPSETTALSRAMREQEEPRRLARVLPKGAGYALVDEAPDADETLKYRVICQVSLAPEGLKFVPEDTEFRSRIEAAYQDNLKTVSSDEVREWLNKALTSALAIRLRDTGGVYFVPQIHIEWFNALVEGVRASSANQIFGVPAERSENVVAGILDAVLHESENETKKLRTDLQDTKLGTKALKTRADLCAKQEAKLVRYAELLDRNVASMTKELKDMQAHLMEAIIKSEEKK